MSPKLPTPSCMPETCPSFNTVQSYDHESTYQRGAAVRSTGFADHRDTSPHGASKGQCGVAPCDWMSGISPRHGFHFEELRRCFQDSRVRGHCLLKQLDVGLIDESQPSASTKTTSHRASPNSLNPQLLTVLHGAREVNLLHSEPEASSSSDRDVGASEGSVGDSWPYLLEVAQFSVYASCEVGNRPANSCGHYTLTNLNPLVQ